MANNGSVFNPFKSMLYSWWCLLHLSLKSISEADGYLVSMLAGIVPIRSDRQRMLPDQIFYIRLFFVVMESDKILAGLECYGVIHLMYMLLFLAFCDCV